jgi:hypothetical protein
MSLKSVKIHKKYLSLTFALVITYCGLGIAYGKNHSARNMQAEILKSKELKASMQLMLRLRNAPIRELLAHVRGLDGQIVKNIKTKKSLENMESDLDRYFLGIIDRRPSYEQMQQLSGIYVGALLRRNLNNRSLVSAIPSLRKLPECRSDLSLNQQLSRWADGLSQNNNAKKNAAIVETQNAINCISADQAHQFSNALARSLQRFQSIIANKRIPLPMEMAAYSVVIQHTIMVYDSIKHRKNTELRKWMVKNRQTISNVLRDLEEVFLYDFMTADLISMGGPDISRFMNGILNQGTSACGLIEMVGAGLTTGSVSCGRAGQPSQCHQPQFGSMFNSNNTTNKQYDYAANPMGKKSASNSSACEGSGGGPDSGGGGGLGGMNGGYANCVVGTMLNARNDRPHSMSCYFNATLNQHARGKRSGDVIGGREGGMGPSPIRGIAGNSECQTNPRMLMPMDGYVPYRRDGVIGKRLSDLKSETDPRQQEEFWGKQRTTIDNSLITNGHDPMTKEEWEKVKSDMDTALDEAWFADLGRTAFNWFGSGRPIINKYTERGNGSQTFPTIHPAVAHLRMAAGHWNRQEKQIAYDPKNLRPEHLEQAQTHESVHTGLDSIADQRDLSDEERSDLHKKFHDQEGTHLADDDHTHFGINPNDPDSRGSSCSPWAEQMSDYMTCQGVGDALNRRHGAGFGADGSFTGAGTNNPLQGTRGKTTPQDSYSKTAGNGLLACGQGQTMVDENGNVRTTNKNNTSRTCQQMLCVEGANCRCLGDAQDALPAAIWSNPNSGMGNVCATSDTCFGGAGGRPSGPSRGGGGALPPGVGGRPGCQGSNCGIVPAIPKGPIK